MDGAIVQGSVQMDLESRANGNHRAEVMKMFVHSGVRRRGPARALMSEVDAAAHGLGRTLLLMDTRKGGEAEKMCVLLGYMKYCEFPCYARSGIGVIHASVF